jgi:riboflavin synthase
VDGVAVIGAVLADESHWRLRVQVPDALKPYVIEKGSVALDGVSLTVAQVTNEGLEVALIPTTRKLTTLGAAQPGTRCNIEVDYFAKIVVETVRRMRS